MALLETLFDDFGGSTSDIATRWTTSGTVSFATGVASLTTASNGGVGQLSSLNVYEFGTTGTSTGITAKVTIPSATSSATVATVSLILQDATGTGAVSFLVNGGYLYRRRVTASNGTTTNVIGTYNATTMAYWRIRCVGTIVYYDYSGDGVTWTAAGNATMTWASYTNTRVNFKVETTDAAPGYSATLDNVNTASRIITTGINDADTIGSPSLTFTASALTPAGINDTATFDNPAVSFTPSLTPDGINDTETFDGAATTFSPRLSPGSIQDFDASDNPAVGFAATTGPAGINDPEAQDTPTVSRWPIPDPINDRDAIGTPDVRFTPGTATPDSLVDLGPIGAPSVEFRQFYTGNYGVGAYGVGLYGYALTPDGITESETLGGPTAAAVLSPVPASITDPETLQGPALSGAAVGTAPKPAGINDGETLGGPALAMYAANGYGQGTYGTGLYGQGQGDTVVTVPDTGADRTNYDYGAGVYGQGPYFGPVSASQPHDNPTYGSGTYGYGIYYGTTPAKEAVPLFNDYAAITEPPMHILGIGPWSPVIYWRGAENFGVGAGNLPARPALPLPPASSKGFTLRLNEGSEARVDLALARGSGIVIDPMDTDLWWRRKDPRTGNLEIIGRFNTAHADLSTSDTGLNLSCQFEDYRTVLGNRMVLRYRHPDWRTDIASQWGPGAKVTDILAWALPKNTRLDLSEVTGDNPYPLGEINHAFVIAPGTTIADVMENLNAISRVRWEWWVETPNNINEAPKLRFILGSRGLDKGVVLHDLGKGPSPIASWTRQSASDNYANSIIYNGGTDANGIGGSVVKTIPAQIIQYGQRDVQDGNSSLAGDVNLINARATRKLEKLATRDATYTIRLATGFWRGRSHIDVGDTIRLVIRLGKEVIDEKHRVTEIGVEIDENNLEEVTLTLGTPTASPDPRSRRAPLQRVVRYLRDFISPGDNVTTPDDE